MAVDKVKPLKIESSATGGTDDNMFPHETDPAEDYLAAKGIAFENQDTTLIDLDVSDNIQFTDPIVGTKSVDQVQSTARVSATDTTPDNLFAKIVAGAGIVLAKLSAGANEKLEITATAADPFAAALFDDNCNPLFSKNEDGTVELLEACT